MLLVFLGIVVEFLEVVSPRLEKPGNNEIGRTQMTIFDQVWALFLVVQRYSLSQV